MAIFAEIKENECVKDSYPVKSDNSISTARSGKRCEIGSNLSYCGMTLNGVMAADVYYLCVSS